MRAAELLVRCLEAEGVDYVFGLPGEEALEVLDALSRSPIHFITTRHEQGAAFMADVYGRLTGRAGVCLSTLGPGATNLLTGVADAYLDHAPLVAITAQASLPRSHKESHQYIPLAELFRPVTKWNARVERPEVIPQVVRKAFRLAEAEKPGATHLELPEDVAGAEVTGEPLRPDRPRYPRPHPAAIDEAARLLAQAERPLILAGNGVIRRRASRELRLLAQELHLPVVNTFMAKGVVDYRDHLSLQTIGLQSRDWVMCGLDRADLVLCVGYDLVEYDPVHWNPEGKKAIVHLDTLPAEVDEHYQPQVEVIGEIGESLAALAQACSFPKSFPGHLALRDILLEELREGGADDGFPLKPQRILFDLRHALADDDILLSDVGAHKLWVARLFPAAQPGSVLISNGFAAMGFALPGAIAAKLVHPERRVVAVCGDGGFLMNSQELETAQRLGVAFVTVVWVDDGYGLIDWKQRNRFGRAFGAAFGNPDLVAYAQSFGLPAFAIEKADDLLPTLRQALELELPSVIAVPVDYAENLRLTERLGHLVCPI